MKMGMQRTHVGTFRQLNYRILIMKNWSNWRDTIIANSFYSELRGELEYIDP